MESEVENREGNQDKLLSSIRDLAGSFTASSRDLRDQVAAISGKIRLVKKYFIYSITFNRIFF